MLLQNQPGIVGFFPTSVRLMLPFTKAILADCPGRRLHDGIRPHRPDRIENSTFWKSSCRSPITVNRNCRAARGGTRRAHCETKMWSGLRDLSLRDLSSYADR